MNNFQLSTRLKDRGLMKLLKKFHKGSPLKFPRRGNLSGVSLVCPTTNEAFLVCRMANKKGSHKWRIIIPVRKTILLAITVGPYMHSSFFFLLKKRNYYKGKLSI